MPTQFCSMLDLECPIVAFSPNPRVVAAVTNAGGLGVFGAAPSRIEEVAEALTWIDGEVGGRPYGVDLLAPMPRAAGGGDEDPAQLAESIPGGHRDFVGRIAERFGVPAPSTDVVPRPFGDGGLVVSRRNLQDKLDLALSHPIRLLVSALGPFSADVVERAHAADVLVGGMCGSVRHAEAHVAARADVIVAQGSEAAGHTGEVSTMVLVPQVVDAVAPVPVLAAGGLGSGRQLAAALALGAQAGWLGTIWLTTTESDVDPRVIDKLLRAGSEDTVRTRSYTGKPVRMLRTEWEQAWDAPDAPPPLPAPLQGLLAAPAIGGIYEHGVEPLMSSAAGQVVGQIATRESVAEVVARLMAELRETLGNLNETWEVPA